MTAPDRRARGRLHVVATPIGNVADLSPRAAEVLAGVAIVAAEDTRRTGRLLSNIGVKTRLIPCHEHNEADVVAALLEALDGGDDVALVSDAGTPLISDPGWRLVRAARAHGVDVVAVPGPSALTAALSIAGLPTDRFVFEGFLPRKSGQRRERLALLAAESRTLVFFESVHRIEATLDAMADAFGGDREAAVARELTKLHEETVIGPLESLRAQLGSAIPLLGEFVIVVAGAPAAEVAGDAEIRRIYSLLAEHLPPTEASRVCAEITGAPRNRIYTLTRT